MVLTTLMEAPKEQGEHKAGHGTVKTKEDIHVITMDHFKKSFSLKSLPSFYFIIPNEYNYMVGKKKLIIFNASEGD